MPLCPAILTVVLWLQPQWWHCWEQLGSFAFLFQTVPLACSREGVVPRGDKAASVLCVFESVSHLLDEMLPLKVTERGHKDSTVLPASPHRSSKGFLTLEKASQPSSAITMPEQHCCFAVPGAWLCAGSGSSSQAGGQLTVTGCLVSRKVTNGKAREGLSLHGLCMFVNEGQKLRHPPSSGGGCSPPMPLLAGWLVFHQCHWVCGVVDAFLRRLQSGRLGKVCGKYLKDSAEKLTGWCQGGKSAWVRSPWKRDLACEVKRAQRMLGVRR